MKFVKYLSETNRRRLKNYRFIQVLISVRSLLRSLMLYFRYIGLEKRADPEFLIIGAQKAGTTSLYAYLSMHPQVSEPYTKEIHYFDNNYSRGPNWYRAHFPKRRQGRITGEASPYYLFHPLAARRVASAFPSIKIIVLLRDPVSRAFSHYHHENRGVKQPLSFEESIELEMKLIDKEEHAIREEVVSKSFFHQHMSFLSRGLYDKQIAEWLRYFDKKQFLFLQSEQFFSEPEIAYGEVLDFLSISKDVPRDFPTYNIGTSDSKIPLELRKKLMERQFARSISNLEKLLGRKFYW